MIDQEETEGIGMLTSSVEVNFNTGAELLCLVNKCVFMCM